MNEKAYAKLNLGLDVLKKREDGYHELKMCMQTVGLSDEVEVEAEEKSGIRLICNREDLPTDRRNLAYRAAELFFSKLGRACGVTIRIKKHIPAAAGLAGGSADAAAVFRALNRMFEMPFSSEELRQTGILLGADIPFCICGGTCRAEGIGEKLSFFPALPPCHIVIMKPKFDLQTAYIYENLHVDTLPLHAHPNMERIFSALQTGDLDALSSGIFNILEYPAQKMHPEISDMKRDFLSDGALAASMSGSGSAVFGIFKEYGSAHASFERLKRKQEAGEISEVFLTEPVSRFF